MGIRAKLETLRVKAGRALSAAICGICLILPYRARQTMVFLLHFLLNRLSVKVKLFFNGVSRLFSLLILLPVYFIGIPLTALLRWIFSPRGTAFDEVDIDIEEDSVLDMF